MEGRIRGIFLIGLGVVLTCGLCAPVSLAAEGMTTDADQVIAPQVERREIVQPRIDSEDFEAGLFVGLLSVEDFGVNAVTGVRVAYHVTESFFVEGTYGQSDTGKTSYERLSGAAELLTTDQRELSYYNLSLGYNVLPGEVFVNGNYAFNSALYLIAGAGSTRFAGDDRFTINVGGGYRFLATDWLALHADVRDHLFDIDVLGSNQTTHNIEISLGATLFF